MKVSAYTGTQRTQVQKQKLLGLIQMAILLFIESKNGGGHSAPKLCSFGCGSDQAG